MRLAEVLIILLLSLTLANCSGLVYSHKIAVPSVPSQTDYSPLPSSELPSLLTVAMLRKNPKRVRELLEKHVPPSQRPDEDISQQTISHVSVDTNISSSSYEFDINTIISDEGTLLHWAADFGHSDLIPVLLIRGADIDSKHSSFAKTHLMYAAWKGHDAVVAQLLNSLTADPEHMHSLITAQSNNGQTALHHATHSGRNIVVAQLLNPLAADPERMHNFIMTRDNDGWTALHYAVIYGHDAVAAQLLNALTTDSELIHSLITTQNKDGKTALHFAALKPRNAVLMRLLNALSIHPERVHSLIMTKDDHDRTALHYAADCGYDAIVAQLLNALTADPECTHSLITAQNKNGWTALHYAARCGHGAVAAQLLNALTADPERVHRFIMTQDNDGWTALHLAAQYDHDAVAAQLLNTLVTQPVRMYNLIMTQNNDGRTAFYYACVNRKTETVKVLLERYKEALDKITLSTSPSAARLPSIHTSLVKLSDQEMNQVLDLSVIRNSVEIIGLLARLGANLNVEDGNGDTHLHRAARNRRSAVVTALVMNGAKSQRNNAGKTPHDVAQDLTPEALNLVKECRGRTILK